MLFSRIKGTPVVERQSPPSISRTCHVQNWNCNWVNSSHVHLSPATGKRHLISCLRGADCSLYPHVSVELYGSSLAWAGSCGLSCYNVLRFYSFCSTCQMFLHLRLHNIPSYACITGYVPTIEIHLFFSQKVKIVKMGERMRPWWTLNLPRKWDVISSDNSFPDMFFFFFSHTWETINFSRDSK